MLTKEDILKEYEKFNEFYSLLQEQKKLENEMEEIRKEYKKIERIAVDIPIKDRDQHFKTKDMSISDGYIHTIRVVFYPDEEDGLYIKGLHTARSTSFTWGEVQFNTEPYSTSSETMISLEDIQKKAPSVFHEVLETIENLKQNRNIFVNNMKELVSQYKERQQKIEEIEKKMDYRPFENPEIEELANAKGISRYDFKAVSEFLQKLIDEYDNDMSYSYSPKM